MERGNVIVIAIVVAAISLFAMRFLSDSREDAQLAALSAGDRAGRLGGSGPGEHGLGPDGRGGGALGGGSGGSLGGSRSGPHGAGSGVGGGPGVGFAGRGGSASTVMGGGTHGGGSVGTSGSAAGGRGGSGGTVADIGNAGRVLPKAERQASLVESLGSRPPTKSDLERPVQTDNGDDVALKVDTTQDIADGGGQAVGEVKDADNGDQGIKVEDGARVEFPNAGNASKEGSISFTLKPEWAGADASDNALVQIRQEHEWNNRLEIVKNGEFLRAIVTDNTGKEADISFRITDWQPGEEKTINFSWGKDDSGQGRTELSVDNQVVGRNQYPGELQFAPNTPMIFGADHPGSAYSPAHATIGNFVVGKSPIFTQ
jgi:hypothetical protein